MCFFRVDAKGMPQQAGMGLALPYEKQIALYIFFEDKQGLGFSAHLDASPLAYGEEVSTVVLSDTDPIFRVPVRRQRKVSFLCKGLLRVCSRDFDDFSGFGFQLLLEKVRKPHLTDEAQSLAVFFIGRGQVNFLGQPPHLGFGQLPDWEMRLVKLPLR
tara:strand:+ start:116 stop:589 length:474 start_codon:yes stop_codon:yes gene_type:complete